MHFDFTKKTANKIANKINKHRMALVMVSALLITVCSVGEMYLLIKVGFL